MTVSPSTAQIQVAGTQLFVANVVGGKDLVNRNVTWTSSNTAVATVDANGLATAKGAGQTTIVATSAANTAVKGAAVLTVAAVTPASLSFFQVQNAAGQPATLNNASGQLNIVANVDPGQSGLRTVQLLGTGCRTGAATDTNVVIGSASISGTTGTQTQQQVTIPFLTTQLLNNAALYTNGTCTLSIRGLDAAGAVISGTTVTGPIVTLNNADVTTGTIAGSRGTANDASGFPWTGGNVTVTVTPTTYVRGRTVAGGQVTLSSGSTATITAGTNGTWTAVFDTLTNGTALANLTTPALTATITTVDNSGGTTSSTVITPASASLPAANQVPASVRYDDQAPAAATGFSFITVNAQYDTVADAGFMGAYTLPSNPAVASDAAATPGPVTLGAGALADNSGVDKVTLKYEYTTDGGTTWTAFTSTTQLPATANNAAYSLRVLTCDALNNCSPSTAFGTFGVDFVVPVAVNSSTGAPATAEVAPAAGSLTGAGNLQIVVTDTGVTAGFGATPVTASASRLVPSGSTQVRQCVDLSTGATGTTVAANANGTCPTYALPLNFVLPATDGEYTLTYTVTDRAGNTSAPVTSTFGIDSAAPVVGGITLPTSWVPSATFTAAATDNLDIASGNSTVWYGTTIQISNTGSASPAGVFDATLNRSATITSTENPSYLRIESVAEANASSTGVTLDSVSVRAIDLANNAGVSTTSTIGLTSTIPVDFNFSTAQVISSFATTSSKSTVCNASSCTGSRTTNLTATLNLGTAASAIVNPFTKVCFYNSISAAGATALNMTAGSYQLIGCTTANTSTEISGNRVITYTWSGFDPAAALGTTGSINVVAIGSNDAGSAIISSTASLAISGS